MRKIYQLKNFLPVLLAAGFIVGCSDDDEKEPTCLPTRLPGEESYFDITYNDDNQIESIVFDHYDPDETGNYSTNVTYNADNKIAKISHLQDGLEEAYTSITYSASEIVAEHYVKDGDASFKDSFTKYYLTGGKITSYTDHGYWNDFQTDDSTVFTYNAAGNITTVETYYYGIKESRAELEYDDKFNPYHQIVYDASDDDVFGVFSLSVNNWVKATYYTGDETTSNEIETATYTYDEDGKPLTRKYDWEDEARTFSYKCE
jgi:hypothetical protein